MHFRDRGLDNDCFLGINTRAKPSAPANKQRAATKRMTPQASFYGLKFEKLGYIVEYLGLHKIFSTVCACREFNAATCGIAAVVKHSEVFCTN